MTRRLPLLALALTLAGCASVNPLQPLSGGTARQAWHDLTSAASTSGTLSSYASVRVATPDGRRSFRATIDTDSADTVRMRAFTPVGTEVFAFEVRGDEMVYVDYSAKKSWRGPFSEVAVQLGIPESLKASEFARLLFGLPATSGGADLSQIEQGTVRQGDLAYEVTGLGLARVRRDGSAWRASYEPGSFPPATVTFEGDGDRSITIRHLELSHAERRIEPLVVDPSYACCYRPLIARE